MIASAVMTPVFLSNVGVISAGVDGFPPTVSIVGAIEYPLPPPVKLTDSIILPITAVPAAPDHVVSPVAFANDTLGALLYSEPEFPIAMEATL